jgi:pimeloyl-ACP methyl ester carboxylesterase
MIALCLSALAAAAAASSSAGGLAPVDPEARSFPYPYPVHTYAFESQRQSLRMAYLDERPTSTGGAAAASAATTTTTTNAKTVLLLHGKNFSAAYWAPTIGALKQAGYRVIAPDQIGFGKSSKPESFQFSFAALAAHTGALLTSLGIDKVTVVGHSMGGMLAARFALLYPTRTEKVVLVGPLGLEDYGKAVGPRSVDDWYAREKGQTPDKIRAYFRQSYFGGGAWKPAYEDLIRLQAGFTLHPDYGQVAWVSALTYDMILTQPVVHDLADLAAPTLFIVGSRDRTAVGKDLVPPSVAERMGHLPELARAAAGRIRGARLVEIDGSGHLPQVDAFARYREALLGFLRD